MKTQEQPTNTMSATQKAYLERYKNASRMQQERFWEPVMKEFSTEEGQLRWGLIAAAIGGLAAEAYFLGPKALKWWHSRGQGYSSSMYTPLPNAPLTMPDM
jgi:hypothetical protein